MSNPVVEMTDAQLEAELQKRKAKKLKEQKAAKEKYENEKQQTVLNLVGGAQRLHDVLSNFKEECHQIFEEFHAKLTEYGGIRGNSKGGFSLVSEDGLMKCSRVRSTEPVWDERSQKAIELIKDFLADTVKKRDKDLYEILISFISRNANGDLEYAKVMNLMQHRDTFKDERWLSGLDLIKESFSIHFKAYSYEFKIKDKTGKWQPLNLSFTSI